MAKIFIDDKEYEVKDGKNVLETCLTLGFDLPYFCWHPALGSVGACRQCAVIKYKDEKDDKGKLVMACMEPVADNLRISLKNEESVQFRANVIEWLMTNHPHDCPICDEGGECHLQDMTVMTGHDYRRFSYNKRTYNNQYLGPFINHEMNRCIQCYRCVRFYRDHAGGRDFNAFASRNHVYFGRYEEGTLENEFSGNLVEVCPTGVFTDKTLKKHYTRKWDLTTAPSICTGCSLGCNIIAGERYGSLRRILSRYNGKVNGYFICDRGRFGYEFVNSDKRIKQPLRKYNKESKPEISDKETVLEYIKSLKGKTIGIGSPRASLEANYMLQKLVGRDNFYNGLNNRENKLIASALNILKEGPVRTPSLKEVEKADAVLILGEDVTNTAPMLALSLRQSVHQAPKQILGKMNIPEWNDAAVREAVQDEKGPFYIASSYNTKLSDIATKSINIKPEQIAEIGFSISSLVDKSSPSSQKLNDEFKTFIEQAANDLTKAKNPLIVSGTSLKNENIIKAAANIAMALSKTGKNPGLTFVVPEANCFGSVLLEEKCLNGAFDSIEKESVENVIILENDIYRRENKDIVDKFFSKCKNVIVLDHLMNSTTENADAVIPVGTFAESDGTFINNEGRAQRFYQVYVPEGDVKESWRWMEDFFIALDKNDTSGWTSFEDYINDLVKNIPFFNGIQNLAPPPSFREAGQKIPRAQHRFSGRTAMNADKNVSEPKPPEDPDSALTYTMEGYQGKPPSSIIPFFWSPGWNSVQSINKYQIEIGGSLHDGDPGLRLIEPKEKSELNYFNFSTENSNSKDWLIVPVYHIYGSEELSSLSPAVKELAPKPYAAINENDLKKLNIEKDGKIELSNESEKINLPIKIKNDLPEGIIGVPAGLIGMIYFDFSKRYEISGAK